jgi:outer membrane protein OmpA-like peptidoglycan-associated protein
MRKFNLVCGKRLMLTTVLSSMLVASIAMGSPIDWSYEQVDDEVVWEMTANRMFEDVRLTINPHTGDGQDVFSRPNWRQGEHWQVSTPAPSSSAAITLSFDAKVDGQPWRATVDVPYRAEPTGDAIDYQVRSYDFESDDPHMRIQATRTVNGVELGLRAVSGEMYSPEVEVRRVGSSDYEISWEPRANTDVLTASLRVSGDDGSSREYHYVPWSVDGEVQHMNFAFNSAEIAPEDEPRLREEVERIKAAISRVEEWVDLELYVAGYTDTVGTRQANRQLSERRARAIASFFAAEGVEVPMKVQGFGEEVLAVDTPDGTRSSANRRAIFVLRAGAPPQDERFPRARWEAFQSQHASGE